MINHRTIANNVDGLYWQMMSLRIYYEL